MVSKNKIFYGLPLSSFKKTLNGLRNILSLFGGNLKKCDDLSNILSNICLKLENQMDVTLFIDAFIFDGKMTLQFK